MEQEQIWSLLERGGAVRRGHFQEPGGHATMRLARYNGLLDPAGADSLGVALAQRLADVGADVVLAWEGLEDLVLGFVVARELGCPLVRAFNDGGLVRCVPDLPAGRTAVLVADQVRSPGLVRAILALLQSRGSALARLGVLVDRGPVAAVPSTGLVAPTEELHPPARCPLCARGIPLVVAAPMEGYE